MLAPRALLPALVLAVVASCTPRQQYAHQPAAGPERPLRPVRARVVAPADAAASGLRAEPLVIPFGDGADGTALLDDFLARADAAGARLVTDLAIVLRADDGEHTLECRTEVVPETVTRTEVRPGRTEAVLVPRRVTRTVTEQEYRCQTVTRTKHVTRTESEYRCEYVTKPVHKTRTVYRSEYDYGTRSSRSVPRTESYTEYERQRECRYQPVTKRVTEQVPERECRYEPVTRTVTRYEHQLEQQYQPPRMETIRRQRLRELEPACAVVGPAGQPPGAGAPNRLEGTLYLAD